MNTAMLPLNLQAVEPLLQQNLNLELFPLVSTQVRCLLRQETLIVLVQHPQPTIPRPQRVFACLESTLAERQILGSYKVLMFLRVAGKKQPYACHKVLRETSKNKEKGTEILASPWDEEQVDAPRAQAEIPVEIAYRANQSNKSWLTLITAGFGVVCLFFFGTLYLLTRPCAVGQCQAIPATKKLVEQSLSTVQNDPSGQEILSAQQQLHHSLDLLAAIPPWSRQHQPAQELWQSYHLHSQDLDRLVLALQTAMKAANKSQKPALREAEWVEIQKLWREAIARLQQQSPESEFYALAQTKISAYKANLATVNQRLQQEQQAQEQLKAAQEQAGVAEARQGLAQSLSSWRQVWQTWQAAVSQLEQISDRTTVYQQAQRLLAKYQLRMQAAGERYQKEEFGVTAYDQALRLAQAAKNAENTEQWSQATSYWQQALSTIKKVPEQTLNSAQSQPLIVSYQQALEKAESKLQIALRVQEVRGDLEQTCLSNTKICQYSLDKQMITVHLTPTYLQQMRQASVNAQFQGDQYMQTELHNHVFTLQQAFEAISYKAGLPLAVYTPDGALVETHAPQQ